VASAANDRTTSRSTAGGHDSNWNRASPQYDMASNRPGSYEAYKAKDEGDGLVLFGLHQCPHLSTMEWTLTTVFTLRFRQRGSTH